MPQLLSLTEPVRLVVSFALTALHAYPQADAPVVLGVLTLDLAFVSMVVLLTWSREWHRPATCVLATYNVRDPPSARLAVVDGRAAWRAARQPGLSVARGG